MAKCDLCGGNCKAIELEQLLNAYQTAGVVDVCPSCRKWANKIKGKLLNEISLNMKKAIEDRKGVTRKSWWYRFMCKGTSTSVQRPRSNSALWESDPHNTAN